MGASSARRRPATRRLSRPEADSVDGNGRKVHEIIEFVKDRYPDEKSQKRMGTIEVFIAARPLFGGTVHQVCWDYDSDENDFNDYCYVFDHPKHPLVFLFDESELLVELMRHDRKKDIDLWLIKSKHWVNMITQSITGVIALGLIGSTILAAFTEISLPDEIWSIVLIIVGFYFGSAVSSRRKGKARDETPVTP